MRIFNKCLWHNWEYKSLYHDCSDICIWSSSTTHYRRCKDCNYQEAKIINKWTPDKTNVFK